MTQTPLAITATRPAASGALPARPSGNVMGSKSHLPTPSMPGARSSSILRSLGREDRQATHTSKTNESGLDRLTALNVFVHAADSCSFTEAGRQLGLSSSAVGKCIARLEQRLGLRLFYRNTRCIQLTQEGRSFLESCRKIFLELRTIEQELAQTKGAPKGKLRVSMPLTGTLMIPGLGDFIRAYPEIDLEMDFTDSIVDVVDGGYDLVLRSGDVGDSRLKSRSLGAYRFEIVGSSEYFAEAGIPSKPEDLLDHACLHRKQPTTGKIQEWPIARSATINDFMLPTAATASTLDALIYLAKCGVGIACVPDFCVWEEIATGSLVSVLKDYLEHTEVVRAIWPSSRYTSPKLRAFIDFLAENLLQQVSTTSNTAA